MEKKITSSSTKPEILEALADAQEEQDILHKEISSLNKKIEELETLIQEEDVKKKGLITELTNQTVDIDLAKQQTKQLEKLSLEFGETEAKLNSANQELNAVKGELLAANKKVKLLITELESLKSRALPSGIKKGVSRFFSFKKMAAVGVLVFVAVLTFGAIYMAVPHDNAFMDKIDKFISRVQRNIPIESINPLATMNFLIETNGIVTARHNNENKLQTKNGVVIQDYVITTWASKAGFDGILFGDLENLVNSEININHVASKFKKFGCSNVLALVENKDNLTLPEIFTYSSKGKLDIYESRRKLAGFFPVFWGKEKTQINIKSDNVYAYITSDLIFMEIKGIKACAKLNVNEEKKVTFLL